MTISAGISGCRTDEVAEADAGRLKIADDDSDQRQIALTLSAAIIVGMLPGRMTLVRICALLAPNVRASLIWLTSTPLTHCRSQGT